MAHNAVSYLEEKSKYGDGFIGWLLGWILSLDHKRIGVLYLVTSVTFFIGGIVLGVLMRIEALAPGKTIMEAQTYNQVFTLHGITMIFLFIIPVIPAIFGNFFMPIQIGARDVSFPRLNLFSWYLFMSGAVLAVVSTFTGTADTGWTFYAPYSFRTGTNVTLATFAAFILGWGTILTGLNFVTTIHRLRAPGMTFFRMPLFVWAIYATSWIQVLATPVIGITLLLVIAERTLGVGFFDPTKGGDPVLFQHMFWIYSHPAVYIMILPAMGIISEVLPVYTKRTIFGYKGIAFSSIAIAAIGYFVWGHHMFTSGMSNWSRVVFSFLTFLVAVPSGIKIFNWISTLWKGSITMHPALYYAYAFIILFSIGGLTGLVNGALASDIHIHDTYWVVGHFHYVMFGGTATGFFAALHHWLPKMTGKMYNLKRAKLAGLLFFIGFNVFYGTMLVMGFLGMPRRYYDYLPQFTPYHFVASIGAFVMVWGILVMFGNLIHGLFRGEKASANPWGGTTLEWHISSPPTLENFEEIPTVLGEPYSNWKTAKGE